jgi:hypothetical protein
LKISECQDVVMGGQLIVGGGGIGGSLKGL